MIVEVRAADQIQAKQMIKTLYGGAMIIGDSVYRV